MNQTAISPLNTNTTQAHFENRSIFDETDQDWDKITGMEKSGLFNQNEVKRESKRDLLPSHQYQRNKRLRNKSALRAEKEGLDLNGL